MITRYGSYYKPDKVYNEFDMLNGSEPPFKPQPKINELIIHNYDNRNDRTNGLIEYMINKGSTPTNSEPVIVKPIEQPKETYNNESTQQLTKPIYYEKYNSGKILCIVAIVIIILMLIFVQIMLGIIIVTSVISNQLNQLHYVDLYKR